MTASATAATSFDDWLAYYTDHFARVSDDALKGFWWIHGRDTEETTPPRELAAWSAVNHEMQGRGI